MNIIHDEFLMLFNKGRSINYIAEFFNVTRQAVFFHMKKMNIKREYYEIRICVKCNNDFTTRKKTSVKYCSGCYQEYLRTKLSNSYNAKSVNGLSVRQWQRKAVAKAKTYIIDWKPDFRVHHLNGDITDNHRDNLFVFFSSSHHMKYHHKVKNDITALPQHEIDGLKLLINGKKNKITQNIINRKMSNSIYLSKIYQICKTNKISLEYKFI